MERQSQTGVDLIKFLCSFLVVAIHTQPLRNLGLIEDGFNIITRFAVPFFFFSSGYFLYKNGITKERLLKQAKRLTVLYLVWSAIYLPALIILTLRSGNGVWSVVKAILWDGTFTQLWYLAASIYAVLIILLLHSFMDEKKILILAIVVYYVGIAISTYGPLWGLFTRYSLNIPTRNAAFYAFPFMYFGLYYAHHAQNCIAKLSVPKKLIGFLVSCAIIAAEGLLMIRKMHTQQTMLWIALPFGTACLFGMALSVKVSFMNTRELRVLSTLIYTSHCLFQFIVSELGLDKGFMQFAAVLIISLAFSCLVSFLGRKHSIVRFLY